MPAPTGQDAEPPADAVWARKAALAIWTRSASRDFAGYDPYDALNGRLVPRVVARSPLGRRILTQAVKRCPVPLQPLLGVKRATDAYTLGHALLTCARLSDHDQVANACAGLVSRLESMAVADGESRAWGYHFPVHTRFFSYVPPTPNLIVTTFVAKGMAAVTKAGMVDCTPEVQGAATFILEHLPRVTDHTGQCIGYLPGEDAVVHNANMLAAMVLCEAAETVSDTHSGPNPEYWLEQALLCARFTAARQAADGSWPYSEEPYGRWVDGFHTGFVLEGLAAVARATGDAALRESLVRGLRYYVAQLFGPDGQPKYYPDRPYPYDALSAAQGVETLHVALRGLPDATAFDADLVQAVPGQLQWIRDNLLRSAGRVTYQVHRLWKDRREFPRWAGSPLMSALAGVSAEGGTEGGAK